MSLLECITFGLTILFLGSVFALALYYEYKLREKREKKLCELMEVIQNYVSLNTKNS